MHLSPEETEAVKALLRSSWADLRIGNTVPAEYSYEHLTETERRIVSKEMFERLVTWIQADE